MTDNEMKQAYVELLNEINLLVERAQYAIKREHQILVKKILLLSVLIAITGAALGISIWQLTLRGLNSPVSITLLVSAAVLCVVACVIGWVMADDIVHHNRRLKDIALRFNLKKEELEEGYKNTIKDQQK